jgi:Flp pilus assembly protein TadG
MKVRNSRQRGSSLIEFTLVGIPVIFLLLSSFEVARGMWTYHTLAAAVKRGTRYTVVHGQNCSLSGNTCTVTIAQIAAQIESAGPGLLPGQMSLTFTPATGSPVSCALSSCLSNSTTWPPSTANSPGTNVTIAGSYPFRSIASMLWPSAGRVSIFQPVTFGASSTEPVQY